MAGRVIGVTTLTQRRDTPVRQHAELAGVYLHPVAGVASRPGVEDLHGKPAPGMAIPLP